MRFGYRRLIFQVVGSILLLCGLMGMYRDIWVESTAQVSAVETGVPLPILMYHSILKDSTRWGKYVLSPASLESDLSYLEEHGYQTVTVTDLLHYIAGEASLPEKPIIITFDDGYYNNYLYAYPLLQQHRMRAVLSVIGSQTALFTQSGEENAYWSHVTIPRLREMQDVFELQNHSWSMHEYGDRRGCLRKEGEESEAYADYFRGDTEKAQALFTENGFSAPSCYTYPFGACNGESEELLKNMGFRCSLGCTEKINKITKDPNCLFALGRFNRPSGISTEEFMKRVLQHE